MLVHLVLLAFLWMLTVRSEITKTASGELTVHSGEPRFFHYVLAFFLLTSILLLLLRHARKKIFQFSFLYQFTGIGNLVYATLGLVLLIMGAGQGTIVWIILSFLTGFLIEKDIFTEDAR